jgi:GT2 family glycosyltransferase
MESPRQSGDRISVVVLTLNEGDLLRRTVDSLAATIAEGDEIIVVDDGSTDGSADFLRDAAGPVTLLSSRDLGVSKGRNLGASHARGDLLVFSDAHVETPPGWCDPLRRVLADPKVGAAATTLIDLVERDCRGYGLRLTGPDLGLEWLDSDRDDAYSVPLLTGAFFAMRHDTFDAVGGFDEGMVRWGSEDVELSIRLWLMGYDLRMIPQVEVAHLFREKGFYNVEWHWILHNRLRTAYLHFSDSRYERVLERLSTSKAFPDAYAMLRSSDAERYKAEMAPRKVRDPETYFATFGPEW